jgi:chromosome segregation ATPase
MLVAALMLGSACAGSQEKDDDGMTAADVSDQDRELYQERKEAREDVGELPDIKKSLEASKRQYEGIDRSLERDIATIDDDQRSTIERQQKETVELQEQADEEIEIYEVDAGKGEATRADLERLDETVREYGARVDKLQNTLEEAGISIDDDMADVETPEQEGDFTTERKKK